MYGLALSREKACVKFTTVSNGYVIFSLFLEFDPLINKFRYVLVNRKRRHRMGDTAFMLYAIYTTFYYIFSRHFHSDIGHITLATTIPPYSLLREAEHVWLLRLPCDTSLRGWLQQREVHPHPARLHNPFLFTVTGWIY